MNFQNSYSSFAAIPWFIIGFILMSGIHTLGIIPEQAAEFIVTIAYILIGMAMAGLGLNVDIKYFKKQGIILFIAEFIGSVCAGVVMGIK
ncbi:putative sulfate exporter family transporter [Niallia nealsonii]|uniref:Sulfate exporter family transporter n=1 Tax=Niallia nealsonii TaxID=115979 RepID=A0A2N0Z391_9BACI|nr:putative sulfate exporter family transporter [Niallia nealsonii]PKG23984.1 hypothetical protein CWS01_09470 [Niallia nealsonii]